jgi:hypothetical protein
LDFNEEKTSEIPKNCFLPDQQILPDFRQKRIRSDGSGHSTVSGFSDDEFEKHSPD